MRDELIIAIKNLSSDKLKTVYRIVTVLTK
jgi:hypothetical protein